MDGNIDNTQQQLYDLIADVTPVKDQLDRPFWRLDLVSGYTSKINYDMVAGSVFFGDTNDGMAKAFNAMWSTDVSYSIRAFVWKCFLNMVPTKDQLTRRRIPLSTSDLNRVLCSEVHESLNNLLFFYPILVLVWKNMASWIGLVPNFDPCTWRKFTLWGDCVRKTRTRRRNEGIIWAAVVRGIQNLRNDIIFNEGKCNVDDLIWNVELMA
ncbi:uncharacterized protein LOC131640928 [Vicia villosa]|uniref:uncharacterized protein LOC131640928 n=1 Tax=Vicia villosa TaxID=3911 RepID=UPI00273C3850|nr:uncharacterized protein LOC131640928 [Vicia villosa]